MTCERPCSPRSGSRSRCHRRNRPAGGRPGLIPPAWRCGGEPPPEVIVVQAGSVAGSGAEPARAEVGRVLGVVQEWRGLAELGLARLAVVTRGAVAAVPGEGVADLAGAAVWGLVRSAQSENPGRLVLADLPAGGGGGVAVLAAAVGSGEPEVAVRDGQVYGRRLARPVAGPVRAGGGVLPAGGPVRAGGGVLSPRLAGTVLVTGGTGTLGALVAGHLVATGRAGGLVLASRSGPAAPGAAALAGGLASHG